MIYKHDINSSVEKWWKERVSLIGAGYWKDRHIYDRKGWQRMKTGKNKECHSNGVKLPETG